MRARLPVRLVCLVALMLSGYGGGRLIVLPAEAQAAALTGVAGVTFTGALAAPSAESNIWTPIATAINLSAGGGDNFGAQDVIVDPTNAARLYVTTCYDGLWWSQDYGQTWSKRSTAGGPLDYGKNWCLAIAPDLSAMYTGSGNNSGTGGGGIHSVFKSTNGGVTWTEAGDMGAEPYSIAIDPSDNTHLIASAHENSNLYESFDAGASWTARTGTGASQSGYAWFLTSTRVLLVSDGDAGAGNGTRLGIWGGSSWSWSGVGPASESSQQHYHGYHQIVIDETTSPRTIWNPGAFGIDKSTDDGSTWTRVTDGDSSVLCATSTRLWSGRSYPSFEGGISPNFRTAARPAGSSWDGPTNPAAIVNGPKRFAVTNDGANDILVTSNWRDGLWRYVEAA